MLLKCINRLSVIQIQLFFYGKKISVMIIKDLIKFIKFAK